MVEEIEENLEGFEEVNSEEKPKTSAPSEGQNRPDIRIVQAETSKDGKTIYKNVGGMWKNVSKNGNTFYTIMIGSLKLLAFPNDRK